MIVLILWSQTDDAADFLSALHRDGISEQGKCDRASKDTVFCLSLCEQDALAENHVIAVAGQQRDDPVDVALDDKVALQERLACILYGLLPGWFLLMLVNRDCVAAVGDIFQQGV